MKKICYKNIKKYLRLYGSYKLYSICKISFDESTNSPNQDRPLSNNYSLKYLVNRISTRYFVCVLHLFGYSN